MILSRKRSSSGQSQLAAKSATAKYTKGPPANLAYARSKHANDRLKALINKADTLLADQQRMIEDVSRLLRMEKVAGVYVKVAQKPKSRKTKRGIKKAPR